MSKFSLRPRNTTLLVPGNARNAAHAGPPAPGKQAHHKLHQLDGAAAQREALAPHFGLAARVRSYLAEPLPADAPTEAAEGAAARAPRTPAQALRHWMGKAGTALGLRAGQPVGHGTLTRYRNSAAAGARPIAQDDPQDRGTWRSMGAAQARAFAAGQRLHRADVAVRKAEALERLVQMHIERLEAEVQRAGRRMAHAADRPVPLRQQQAAIAAQRQVLDDGIARLEAEADAIRQRIDHAESALASAPARGRLGPLMNDRTGADRSEDTAGLRQHLRELRTLHAIRSARRDALEQRKADVQGELARLERAAVAIARELFEADDEAADLRSLLGRLRSRRSALEATRDTARQGSETATAALAARGQALIARQIETLPGLRADADPVAAASLRQALQQWAGGLDTSAFAEQAIPAAGIVAVGLKALAMAAGGDPAQALQSLEALRALRWNALVPAPGAGAGTGPGAAPAPTADLPPTARRVVDHLAHVPRGLQVIAHLVRPEGSPTANPERLAAARLALRADALLRAAAPDDAALRAWLGQARHAARTAVHAPDPAKALAACTVDERAAYHALRNGYDSNAPGSAYARANGHLQKIADALHDVARNGAAPRMFGGRPNPLRSLPEALEVGAATALPTPRRRADAALEAAAGQLTEMLGGLRAEGPPGRRPSGAECAWQALAEAVQWAPEGTDRTTMVIDAAALARIAARARELQGPGEHSGHVSDAAPAAAAQPLHRHLQDAWTQLQRRPHTVPEALALLAEGLPEDAGGPSRPPPPPPPGGVPVSWIAYALQRGAQFRASVQEVARLLREGDPAQATQAQALFDLTRDMLGQLEWRDRPRPFGAQTRGVHAGPPSAAAAPGSAGFRPGVGPIAGAPPQRDAVPAMSILGSRMSCHA